MMLDTPQQMYPPMGYRPQQMQQQSMQQMQAMQHQQLQQQRMNQMMRQKMQHPDYMPGMMDPSQGLPNGQGMPPNGQGMPPNGQGMPPNGQGMPNGPGMPNGLPNGPGMQTGMSLPNGLPGMTNSQNMANGQNGMSMPNGPSVMPAVQSMPTGLNQLSNGLPNGQPQPGLPHGLQNGHPDPAMQNNRQFISDQRQFSPGSLQQPNKTILRPTHGSPASIHSPNMSKPPSHPNSPPLSPLVTKSSPKIKKMSPPATSPNKSMSPLKNGPPPRYINPGEQSMSQQQMYSRMVEQQKMSEQHQMAQHRHPGHMGPGHPNMACHPNMMHPGMTMGHLPPQLSHGAQPPGLGPRPPSAAKVKNNVSVVCPVCNKIYANRKALRKHIKGTTCGKSVQDIDRAMEEALEGNNTPPPERGGPNPASYPPGYTMGYDPYKRMRYDPGYPGPEQQMQQQQNGYYLLPMQGMLSHPPQPSQSIRSNKYPPLSHLRAPGPPYSQNNGPHNPMMGQQQRHPGPQTMGQQQQRPQLQDQQPPQQLQHQGPSPPQHTLQSSLQHPPLMNPNTDLDSLTNGTKRKAEPNFTALLTDPSMDSLIFDTAWSWDPLSKT